MTTDSKSSATQAVQLAREPSPIRMAVDTGPRALRGDVRWTLDLARLRTATGVKQSPDADPH